MVGSGRKITVEFLGNNRDLNRAMDDSVRRSGRFSSALKNAGRAAGLGLAAGAVIAAKGLYEMGKMAVEDEASQKQLATQLRNTAKATDAQIAAVEKQIDAQSRATGIADDQLRPALSKLVTATGDVEKAQDLMSLALDASAGTGKSLEQVSKALADAENGRLTGLGKLGIKTKDAAGETKTFAQLQDDMAKKFKGASATAADTMQGRMNRLKVALSETGEAIGYKLLPIVSDMAEWFLKKGLPAIQNFGGWIRDNLFPIIENIADVVKKVFGGMDGDVGSGLGKVKDTIMEIVGVIRDLWHVFGDDIVGYLRDSFKNAQQYLGGALDVIRGLFKVFSSLFKGDWKGVWEGVKLILRGAFNVIVGIFKQALNVLKLLWKVAWTGIKALVGSIWDGIKSLVKNGIDKVVDGIRAIPGKVKDLAGNFRDAGRHVIGALIDGLSKAGSFVADIAGNVWNAVKGMLNAAIDKINAALEFTISLPGPDVHINPPNVPHLAKGGVVRARPGGTLALLGEGGQDEAVIPLGRNGTPRGAASAAATAPITIQILSGVGDPVAIGREVEKVLIRYTGSTGRPLAVQTI